MRLKGKLKSWNDDRGFGFIDPIEGGEEVFVHIKAFPHRGFRPQVNLLVWFEVEIGPQGKRAKNVEFVRQSDVPRHLRHEPKKERGAATLLAIPAFVALYIVVELLWQPPVILAAIYIIASVVTFVVYDQDKKAAQRGHQRTPEVTLHALALAGGWPGALLAQQVLRHKSIKFEFLAVFWVTVILNVGGFVLLCSQHQSIFRAFVS